MTKEEILDEITQLDTKISVMQRDLVLADGARQAFKYILDKLSTDAVTAEPVGEEQHD